VRNHDPDAARAAMHAHMDQSHKRFSVSWRRVRQSKTAKK